MFDWNQFDELELALIAVTLLVLAKDAVFSIRWPKNLRNAAKGFFQPVLPAVTPQDILSAKELSENRRELPTWKYIATVFFAGSLGALWLYRAVFRTVTASFDPVPFCHAAAWVILSIRCAILKSVTPNYAALIAALLEILQVGYTFVTSRLVDPKCDALIVLGAVFVVLVAFSQPVEEVRGQPQLSGHLTFG
jgi:hypothetical protein